ncbi:hypothetical protein LTR16_012599, partial [Cryomyces antarcticus]
MDYDKFARLTGYTPASGREIMRRTKKTLAQMAESGGGSSSNNNNSAANDDGTPAPAAP